MYNVRYTKFPFDFMYVYINLYLETMSVAYSGIKKYVTYIIKGRCVSWGNTIIHSLAIIYIILRCVHIYVYCSCKKNKNYDLESV